MKKFTVKKNTGAGKKYIVSKKKKTPAKRLKGSKPRTGRSRYA